MRSPSTTIAAIALSVAGSAFAGDLLETIRSRGQASLGDCYALALEHGQDAAIAEARLAQAEARQGAGRGALLPQVTLQGTEFRQNEVAIASGDGTVVTTSDRRREARAHLDQPITRFGAEWAGLHALEQDAAAERAARDAARRNLWHSVADRVAAVVGAEQVLDVRQRTSTSSAERLREMEARAEVGLARRAEVLRTKAQHSADEAELEDARRALEVARENLTLVLGVRLEVPLASADILAARSATGEGTTLDQHPDVVEATARAEAERLRERVQTGEFWPRLDLSANWYLDRNGYSTFQQQTDWDATLLLSWPVFSGGSSRARRVEARAARQEAELERAQVRARVERDLRAAEAAVRSGTARLAHLDDAVRLAEETARLVEEEYRQGLATSLEVEVAQVELSEARLEWVQQRLRVFLDGVELDLARGAAIPGGSK